MNPNKPFPIETELIPDEFRVAIFGSARIKPGEPIYQRVFDLAREVGKRDIDIVTGGGPGVMEAANYGHKVGSSDESQSIGLTIELPFESEGNKHLDIKRHFHKFSERLDTFMKLSNVLVVMPGGIGTALELFYAWQLIQVQHVPKMPIILHGEEWHHLTDWVHKDMLDGGYIDQKDLDCVYCVKHNHEALEIIFDAYDRYKKTGKETFKKYGKYGLR
ncbi:LOG family protein [Candidatus Gracilibacteria bacterium]|nr:LOG family protein [Candidatus Gracilibacteria bacterium]